RAPRRSRPRTRPFQHACPDPFAGWRRRAASAPRAPRYFRPRPVGPRLLEDLVLNFGIMGTGRMAVRLADLAASGGHRVTLGSRSPERARRIAAALREDGAISGGSYDDAVACDIVMPSIFIRDGALDQLAPFAD